MESKEMCGQSSRSDYVNAQNDVTKLIKVHKITYYMGKLENDWQQEYV